ncbi:crotonase superfamily protein [Tanacetum coccineum]
MGGGARVSIPGTFRVATDKTVSIHIGQLFVSFATPETLIGFHPDAGASFHLSHLPGHLGMKVTSNTPTFLPLPEYFQQVKKQKLPQVEEYLKNLRTDDPSVIESSLQKHSYLDYPDNSSESEARKTDDGWCDTTLKKLKCASPLSLKVSLRSVPWNNERTLDTKELNAIIGAWFTIWRQV